MSNTDWDGHDAEASLEFTGAHGEVLTGEIVDAGAAILQPASGSTRRVPPVAVDRILQAAPDVIAAVHGGKIMRVIGGPSGPLWKVDGGVLATVRGEKGIVGHLRFDGPPKDVRIVAAPAAVFQVASAVTLQYYLNTITSQLESLQHGIADIKELLSTDERAELEAAEQSCADVARHLAAGTALRSDDLVKLNNAHNVGRRRFAAARERLDVLSRLVRESVTETGDIRDRNKFKRALKKAATDGVRDHQDLLRAAALTVQALAVIAASEAEDPTRLATTRDAAIREIAQLRADLTRLSGTLESLNVRRSAIEREYTYNPLKWGKEPYEDLEVCRTSTKRMRQVLHQPAERLLPELVADTPWIMELRAGADGTIEACRDELELGPLPTTSASSDVEP